MSAESKKLIWIISACLFLLIVLAIGFFLFAPKKDAFSSSAPASISNSAPPKAPDPQDFLSNPPPAPAVEQPAAPGGGVTIIYGDKPKSVATQAPQSPAAQAPAAGNAAAAASQGPAAATPKTGASGQAAAAGQAGAAAKAGASSKPTVAAKAGAAAAKVQPKAPAAKASEYWIQAASFVSRGRADELKQSLAEKGIASLISVKDISGKSWYRVRVGPYSAKAEADGWLAKLKPLPGCGEAYIAATAAPAPAPAPTPATAKK
jgi:DedD protein